MRDGKVVKKGQKSVHVVIKCHPKWIYSVTWHLRWHIDIAKLWRLVSTKFEYKCLPEVSEFTYFGVINRSYQRSDRRIIPRHLSIGRCRIVWWQKWNRLVYQLKFKRFQYTKDFHLVKLFELGSLKFSTK